jgi:hypothetical protein
MTFTFLSSRVGVEEHPSMSVGKLTSLCHDPATDRRRRCKATRDHRAKTRSLLRRESAENPRQFRPLARHPH